MTDPRETHTDMPESEGARNYLKKKDSTHRQGKDVQTERTRLVLARKANRKAQKGNSSCLYPAGTTSELRAQERT